jgi:cell division protein FtsL
MMMMVVAAVVVVVVMIMMMMMMMSARSKLRDLDDRIPRPMMMINDARRDVTRNVKIALIFLYYKYRNDSMWIGGHCYGGATLTS